MQYRKIIIGFLTIFLMILLLPVLILCADDFQAAFRKPEISLIFAVQSGENQELIDCWEDSEGTLYVFLPGYAAIGDVSVATVVGEIRIGNIPVTERMSCSMFELDEAYPFFCIEGRKTLESTITFVRSGGIPSLYIDVPSGSMEYIHMEKGNEEQGRMRMYDEDGNLLYSGLAESLKGRGNASWTADKKPYSLTLFEEENLLNMGRAKRWILLADGDNPVNIRNKIVYDFSRSFGLAYSPDCRYTDLYLNGEYAGLYLLCERNEIHQERINLPKEGSFLVSQEIESRLQDQKYPYILTESGQALRIHESDGNFEELQRHWQSVENAILAEDGVDPISGRHWLELIDLDSWARKFLVEEVFGNNDGGCVSQFYYYDSNNLQCKVYAGPVWDYDYAMGGSSVWLKPYCTYLTANRAQQSETMYAPWYPALYQNDEFYQYAAELFQSEMIPLMEQLIHTGIKEYSNTIADAIITDTLRWNLESKTAFEDIEYIQSFLTERMSFFENMWVNEEVYHVVCVDPGRYGLFGHFGVKNGECLPEIVSAEELGGLGWYVADTDQPFDVTQPIYENVHICIRRAENHIPKIHYIPVIALIGLLLVILVVDTHKIKKHGRVMDAPAKVE